MCDDEAELDGSVGCWFGWVGSGRLVGSCGAQQVEAPFTQGTTVLEGADRRPQTALDGDWHTIVDPYFTGLYSFHHEEKKDGWFLKRAVEGRGGQPPGGV